MHYTYNKLGNVYWNKFKKTLQNNLKQEEEKKTWIDKFHLDMLQHKPRWNSSQNMLYGNSHYVDRHLKFSTMNSHANKKHA